MPGPYNKRQQGRTTYTVSSSIRWAVGKRGDTGESGCRLCRGRHALQINCKNVYRQFSTQFYAATSWQKGGL